MSVAKISTSGNEWIECGPCTAVELKTRLFRFTRRLVNDINSFQLEGTEALKFFTLWIDYKIFGCSVTLKYEETQEHASSVVRTFEVFDRDTLDNLRIECLLYKDRIIDDLDYRCNLSNLRNNKSKQTSDT